MADINPPTTKPQDSFQRASAKKRNFSDLNADEANAAMLVLMLSFFSDSEQSVDVQGQLSSILGFFGLNEFQEFKADVKENNLSLGQAADKINYQNFNFKEAKTAINTLPGFDAVGADVKHEYLSHLRKREGYRNVVYRDSLGKPTVGVGHLVKPSDNLKVGDKISDDQVMAFLEKDSSHAFEAAQKQAAELGVTDPRFVIALGSVNYQLGTGWRKKFPSTWAEMKDGNFAKAADKLETSLWNKQTPVRVDDFQKALALAENLKNDDARSQFKDNFGADEPKVADITPDLNKTLDTGLSS